MTDRMTAADLRGAVTFTVPGPPVPFARAGSNGKRRFTPPRQKAHARAIQTLAAPHFRAPLAGPVKLTIFATFPVPASCTKAERIRRMAAPHTQKPDADNIGKLVKDALSGIAYGDDAQVADLTVRKVWGHEGRTVVTVEAAT